MRLWGRFEKAISVEAIVVAPSCEENVVRYRSLLLPWNGTRHHFSLYKLANSHVLLRSLDEFRTLDWKKVLKEVEMLFIKNENPDLEDGVLDS